MPPKKSAAKKSAPRKAEAKKTHAPKAPSPMRKMEHSIGPQVDGLAEQARAAHAPPIPVMTPAIPRGVGRSTPPPMNTPPTSSPASSQVDEGQRS